MCCLFEVVSGEIWLSYFVTSKCHLWLSYCDWLEILGIIWHWWLWFVVFENNRTISMIPWWTHTGAFAKCIANCAHDRSWLHNKHQLTCDASEIARMTPWRSQVHLRCIRNCAHALMAVTSAVGDASEIPRIYECHQTKIQKDNQNSTGVSHKIYQGILLEGLPNPA